MGAENNLKGRLQQLNNAVNEVLDFFQQGSNYEVMVYELWSAKDTLGHLTFWHESFSRNLSDLANGKTPSPMKGKLSELNKLGVDSAKTVSIEDLLNRFQKAQRSIEKNIFDERIDLIPYKKGSRDYSRIEHLAVVTNHIRKHQGDLKTKMKNGKAKN